MELSRGNVQNPRTGNIMIFLDVNQELSTEVMLLPRGVKHHHASPKAGWLVDWDDIVVTSEWLLHRVQRWFYAWTSHSFLSFWKHYVHTFAAPIGCDSKYVTPKFESIGWVFPMVESHELSHVGLMVDCPSSRSKAAWATGYRTRHR